MSAVRQKVEKPADRFKRRDRVSVKKEYRKWYVGKVRGEVIMPTSLGIAVKVRWDGREIEGDQDDWINADHIEKETRR